MPLTVQQRFFISTDVAANANSRLHATLEDKSYLLLVLKHDQVHQRWYITFDERGLPPNLMNVGSRVAVKMLRQREDYVYGRTILKAEMIRELALDICSDSRILNAVKTEGGAYIDTGTQLSALVGSDTELDVPEQFQERWYANSRLVSLTGRPVHIVDIDPAHP